MPATHLGAASQIVSVRIGELAASSAGGPELTSIGLGSCVALVLLDAARGVAGLAHVMLPSHPGRAGLAPGKYADSAVPALLDGVIQAGAERSAVIAVLVGAACMFSFSSVAGMDIGARNEAGVRAALAAERIPVAQSATGGSVGRSVRVAGARGLVVVREAHGSPRELYRGPS